MCYTDALAYMGYDRQAVQIAALSKCDWQTIHGDREIPIFTMLIKRFRSYGAPSYIGLALVQP
jgi:hypothetical protein